MKETKGSEIALSFIVIAVMIAFGFGFNYEYKECSAAGGELVRGLYWFKCIK